MRIVLERARKLRTRGFVYLLLSLLVAALPLWSQVDTGAITGTVTDQSGAVVPGVKVTITNQGTGIAVSTVTESSGHYIFTPLKIGTYTVTAEFQGFQKETHKDITVNVQQTPVVDFSLQPGQVTQTVEVTGAAPLLQTENASVGQGVSGREVNDLPLNGRNFTFLAQLAAGVTVAQPDTRGNAASGAFSANGNRPAQNNYLLDGIDNNADLVDFLNGTNFVVLPPPDAIGEFKVQTSNYSAEFGRAGGAVLNATLKSGTNQIHGDIWEFFRNNVLDARDFFEANNGEYRLNQFGGAVGGPITIPHVYNGRDKTFFFADYQGTRLRQGIPYTNTVPTDQEISSGFSNWSQLLTSATQTDPEGRTFQGGQIFDPATTRGIGCGATDPVTGKPILYASPNSTTPCTAGSTVYVRDPFPGNILPPGRLDPNSMKLLSLYPSPNGSGTVNNYIDSPVLSTRADSFDGRVDHNFNERDQMFASFSYVDEPQLIPGPFTGFADGGAFQDGDQTAVSINSALSWTHTFSPTLINEARLGFSRIGTSRLQANGTTLGIPEQFDIQDIPQVSLNGGLPEIDINGLNTLGSNGFLVSDEVNSTVQFTENLTKIRGNHDFKGGLEFQHIKFSTLQPAFARGNFAFDGSYTNIPNGNGTNLGAAQLLLTPIPATVPGGVNYVGGSDSLNASNIANTDDGRNYYGLYVNDDWKVKPKLTLNLGLRWDYFEQVHENFGAQANFIPGFNGSQATYLIPSNRKNDPQLSSSFVNTLAEDNIALAYTSNAGLGTSQKTNFAPRLGLAYQVTPKLVARAGYGMFYGGFENRGYSPNLGENYPFVYNFSFSAGSNGVPANFGPITYGNGCSFPAATMESGFACIPLTASVVNAEGLGLEGIQYNYITPYTQDANFFLQYQLTPNTTLEAGYVGSFSRHLETFIGSNQVEEILPPGTNVRNYLAYPDFSQGQSYDATEGNSFYNGAQFTLQRRFSNGLNFLTDYTYSKCRTDTFDLLNNSSGGLRAPYLPGFGIQGDYTLCAFDIRNTFKASGAYELPFGKGKRFLGSATGALNQLVGGWSTNWILTLQDGQPFTIGCQGSFTVGLGCNALLVPGQNVIGGLHNVNQWMNPAAFQNPPAATAVGQTDYAPLGGAGTQVAGPGFHRLDLSFFKNFQTTERTHLEFRAEFFNITNHPNFNQPNFGGNGVVAVPGSGDFTNPAFGQIGSTRDAPNDPREIQFALKFYF
ncbi:MAG TPA: TonB-dependent receptor [Terriglobia bacterium]